MINAWIVDRNPNPRSDGPSVSWSDPRWDYDSFKPAWTSLVGLIQNGVQALGA